MLGDAAEAEDVAQEAMLRLWRRRAGLADRRGGGRHLALPGRHQPLPRPAARAGATTGERRPRAADDAPSAFAGAGARRPRGGAATRRSAELPDRQRLAIVAAALRGARRTRRSPAILGVSVEAVESLLARGRRELAAAARAAPRRTGARP